MTVSVVTSWSASYATPASLAAGAQPAPGCLSLPVTVANTAGDWMVAVVAWRTLVATAVPAPTVSVGDGTNWWEPLLPGSSTSSASGDVRCSIWVAPAANAVTLVQIAPTDFVPAIACTIYDVAGLLPWIGTSAVSAFANAATTVSATLGAPASQAIIFTVSASDNLSDTISLASGGWGSVTTETASNGSDHTSDIACKSAYQISSGSVTGHWTSTGSVNLADVVSGILVAAPGPQTGVYPPFYQPTYTGPTSPNWPSTIYECAPGAGMQTPPDELTWVPLDAQALSLNITQGRQYETAQLSTGEGTLVLDNPTGALIPPGTGSFTGLTSGTPVRTRQIWQGGNWQMSFTGDGSTATPQSSTGHIFPVVAGQSYYASAWLACSVPYASGVKLLISWYTAGGSLISASSSSLVTGTVATLATISNVTAPATAALAAVLVQAAGTPASTVVFYAAAAPPVPVGAAYLTVPPAVSWTAANGATVSTLLPFTPDQNGPPDNTPWYVPFNGFLERLPQAWDANYRGVTQATITDAWFGVNFTPQPILPTEVLNDDPYAYWPCSDAAGSSTASNLAAGNSLPLTVTTSPYGVSGATQQFGQNGQALLGAQSTVIVSQGFKLTNQAGMWEQTIGSDVDGVAGYGLTCIDGNFPALSTPMMIEGWFQVNATEDSSLDAATLWAVSASGYPLLLSLQISLHSNNLSFQYTGADGNVNSTSSFGTVDASTLYHIVSQVSTTAYAVWLNGTKITSGSFSDTPLKTPTFSQLAINSPVIASPNLGTGPFTGFTAHIAVYPRALHPARILTHYQAGVTAMAGEPAYYRLERLLQAGNATGRRVIQQEASPDSDQVVSCQDIPGQPASSSIANVAADLLPGLFYIAPTGDMVYQAKVNSYNQAIQWVLGDSTAGGEYGYENDIAFDYDPSRIQNEIQLTQLDDQSVTTPGVPDIETASQIQYGTISNLATGYLQGDANYPLNYGPGLLDLANWLACTYQAPSLRLTQVTVDAASQPSAWPFVLGASTGDMVTVNRRQFSATPLITVTGRITQTNRTLQYDASGITGSVTCIIDPAPEEDALTCDDTVRGQLNGTDVFGW